MGYMILHIVTSKRALSTLFPQIYIELCEKNMVRCSNDYHDRVMTLLPLKIVLKKDVMKTMNILKIRTEKCILIYICERNLCFKRLDNDDCSDMVPTKDLMQQ